MIARASFRPPSAWSCTAEIPAQIFSIGSVQPITPVDATKTSSGAIPSLRAAASHIVWAFRMPASPVATLAMPEVTTMARARPPRTCARETMTGAPGTVLRVNIAAAAQGRSEKSSPTSSRSGSSYLTPACTAPAR
jgi:hypothetical protein